MNEQLQRLKLIMKKISSVQRILDEINEIANQDGEVTEEEVKIINSINYHFEKYVSMLETVLEDGKIDDFELEQIYAYEKKIVQMASSEAFTDGKISRDEKNLIESLIANLEEIQEL